MENYHKSDQETQEYAKRRGNELLDSMTKLSRAIADVVAEAVDMTICHRQVEQDVAEMTCLERAFEDIFQDLVDNGFFIEDIEEATENACRIIKQEQSKYADFMKSCE